MIWKRHRFPELTKKETKPDETCVAKNVGRNHFVHVGTFAMWSMCEHLDVPCTTLVAEYNPVPDPARTPTRYADTEELILGYCYTGHHSACAAFPCTSSVRPACRSPALIMLQVSCSHAMLLNSSPPLGRSVDALLILAACSCLVYPAVATTPATAASASSSAAAFSSDRFSAGQRAR